MRRLFLVIVVGLLLIAVGLPANAQDNQTVYTVAPGDNLFRISLRFGVSINQIAAANGITNVNLIFAGQQLVIPTGGDTTPPPDDGDGDDPPAQDTVYTVVRGDTLGRIARRFNTTVQAIAAANNIANINLIFVGQRLTIPGGSGVQPTPPPDDGGDTTPPPNTAPVTGFALGGQVLDASFRYADQMRGTGMTWAKIQLVWNRGDSPNVAQGLIDAAQGRGFRVLLSVIGNPTELAANPSQYYQEFATFLGGVAALGADGIEVWNEQNIDREWPVGLINGAQYTQMLSAAYQAIKNSNPNTLVVSGAPAPTGGLGCSTSGCNDDVYLGQMRAAGAAQFMDCVGIHYNAGAVPPSATSGAPVGSAGHYSWYYPSMVNLYRSNFPNKPLCFTEIGYLSGEGFSEPLPAAFSWASGTSVAEQAQWLAQAAVQARNSGVVRLFIVWNVDATQFTPDPQAGYAIVRPDGTCPACNAIAAALSN